MRLIHAAPVLAFGLALTGAATVGACGLPPAVDLTLEGKLVTADAQDAADTVEVAAAVAALPSLAMTSDQKTLSSIVAAQSGLAKFFLPSSCLTVTAEGNVVTYAFDHCTGPWGAVDLTGAEVVTFSPGDGPGSTLLEMHSEDLRANGVPVEHHADVLVTLEAGGRRVLWQGGFSGTNLKGKPFSNASDLDLFLGDDGCDHLDGSTTSEVGVRGVTLDFQDIQRCGGPGFCPDGVISATGKLSGVTIDLVFDGTKTVIARGENGGELEVPLNCKPPEAPAP